MKKTLLITITLSILLFSCDKREDFFKELNEAPSLRINSKNNVGTNHLSFTDNVVDSFKISQGSYIINVAAADDNKNLKLNIFVSPTTGSSLTNNLLDPVINGKKEEINGQVLLNVTQANTYIINFEAVDKFKTVTTAQAKVTIFNNLPPVVPNLVITHDPNLNQYEHKFNASSAFDQDEKYGGKIVSYNWVVDNAYNVNTEFNIIQYIFPGPGTYQVKVRCQDNDGAWSPFKIVPYSVL